MEEEGRGGNKLTANLEGSPPPGCEEIGARWAKEQELDSIKLPQLFTGYETEVNVYFN